MYCCTPLALHSIWQCAVSMVNMLSLDTCHYYLPHTLFLNKSYLSVVSFPCTYTSKGSPLISKTMDLNSVSKKFCQPPLLSSSIPQHHRYDVSTWNYLHPVICTSVQGDLYWGTYYFPGDTVGAPPNTEGQHQYRTRDTEQPIQAGPLGTGVHAPHKYFRISQL